MKFSKSFCSSQLLNELKLEWAVVVVVVVVSRERWRVKSPQAEDRKRD